MKYNILLRKIKKIHLLVVFLTTLVFLGALKLGDHSNVNENQKISNEDLLLPKLGAGQKGSISTKADSLRLNKSSDTNLPFSYYLDSWNKLRESSISPNQLSIELGQIVMFAAEAGYAKEVFDLIDSSYSHGKIRAHLITSLFSEIDNPSISRKIYLGLSSKDFSAANTGVKTSMALSMRQLTHEKPFDTSNFDYVGKGKLEELLSDACSSYAAYMSVVIKLDTIDVLDAVKSLSLNSKIAESAYVFLAVRDPEAVYNHLKVSGIELSEVNLQEVLKSMCQKNPGLGLPIVAQNNQLSADAKLHLMLEHIKFDSNISADKNWDQATNQLYLSAKAIVKLGDGYIAESWRLRDELTNQDLKKLVERKIWGKERDMVRNTVNAAPQKAIEELVSGKSQHDSYWIEEAMDVWLKKDFASAEQWYQQNWKTLPKEKAQYAAASFARQAIQAGDIDAAQQWMPYIQDAKTKARIEGQLIKAQQK